MKHLLTAFLFALSIVASAQTVNTDAAYEAPTTMLQIMTALMIWSDILAVTILFFAMLTGRKRSGGMNLRGMNAVMEDWSGLPQVIVLVAAVQTTVTISAYAIGLILDIIK